MCLNWSEETWFHGIVVEWFLLQNEATELVLVWDSESFPFLSPPEHISRPHPPSILFVAESPFGRYSWVRGTSKASGHCCCLVDY